MARKASFNYVETNKLLSIIEKYKEIFECKKSDADTSKLKEDTWHKVAIEFNATSELCRSVKELKTKYKNVRYFTKTKLALERKKMNDTSRSPPAQVEFTEAEDTCGNMLHIDKVECDENSYNCDDGEKPSIEISPSCSIKAEISTPSLYPSTLQASINDRLRKGKRSVIKSHLKKVIERRSKRIEERQQPDLPNDTDLQSLQRNERHRIEMKIFETRLESERVHLESERVQLEREKVQLERERLQLERERVQFECERFQFENEQSELKKVKLS